MEGNQSYSGSRDQFEFEETLVDVEILEEIPPMDFQVLTIGPFLKGETVSVPRWIADILEQYDLVLLKDKGKLDITQVTKTAWKEKDDPILQEIDPFFYTKIKKRINWLKNKLASENNPILERELIELEKTREKIIEQRISKMLKILGRRSMRDEEEKRLSQEEKTLYKVLVKLLKDWEEEQVRVGE